MLNSRPVADEVIKRFNLQTAYHAKDMTAARLKLARNTEVASEKEGFISISITDSDKKRSAQIANAYIDALRELTQSLSASEAAGRKFFYDEQLRQAKDSLVFAEFAFQRVQQTRGLVQLDAQTKGTIEQLATIRAQITARQVLLQSLRSYSTERNPDVQLAEREVSSLEAEESRLEEGAQRPDRSDLGLHNLSDAGLDYARAEHEVRYRETLLDLLLKQYDAARLDEARGAPVIQVLEPAIEPDRHSSPNRSNIIVMMMLLGFAGSCAWVMLAWLKESLTRREEVAAKLMEIREVLSK